MSAALIYLVPLVGVLAACVALGVSRASYYRARAPRAERAPRPTPPRALSETERAEVLALLDSDRFADKTPREAYASLLDHGEYKCSPSTMYRILRVAHQVRERRNQRRHPVYVKPELRADRPNQVWCWDITKVPGPTRGTYYSLFVALDLFSRYAVGWLVARTESAALAQAFLAEAVARHNICPGQLVCHADRGTPMVAKSTALLFADLGITASHSRPHVSDDNPFSEAVFRTLLYRPEMPARFGSIEHARSFFSSLMHWYNEQHYHSGIAHLTPSDVHFGRAPQIIAARQTVLDEAYNRRPDRFVRQPPRHPEPASVVWINPPATTLTQF